MATVDVNDGTASRGRAARRAGPVLYWLAVGVISIALVVGFVLLLGYLDGSYVGVLAASCPRFPGAVRFCTAPAVISRRATRGRQAGIGPARPA